METKPGKQTAPDDHPWSGEPIYREAKEDNLLGCFGKGILVILLLVVIGYGLLVGMCGAYL